MHVYISKYKIYGEKRKGREKKNNIRVFGIQCQPFYFLRSVYVNWENWQKYRYVIVIESVTYTSSCFSILIHIHSKTHFAFWPNCKQRRTNFRCKNRERYMLKVSGLWECIAMKIIKYWIRYNVTVVAERQRCKHLVFHTPRAYIFRFYLPFYSLRIIDYLGGKALW